MRILVVGGGFEGIYAAFVLAGTDGLEVDLVEPGDALGGILRGTAHRGVVLDSGCQLFDNFDVDVTKNIQKLCGGSWRGVDVSYGSRLHGQRSACASAPDLEVVGHDRRDQIVGELIAASDNPICDESLYRYCAERWGPAVAAMLRPVAEKVLGLSPDALDGLNRAYLPLNRVRVLNEADSWTLKLSSAEIDARIAVARPPGGALYPAAWEHLPAQNLHPGSRSMRGFCDSALLALENVGVRVQLRTSVEALGGGAPARVVLRTRGDDVDMSSSYDAVVWATRLPQLESLALRSSRLAQLVSPMGMHLFYYFAPEEAFVGPGYFHNFDSDTDVYRWSRMGGYSAQVTQDGLSFCCAEVPEHERIRSGPACAQKHWDELLSLGLVEGRHDGSPYHVWSRGCVPRLLPGYARTAEGVIEQVRGRCPAIVVRDPKVSGRVGAARQLVHDTLARL
jgi:hypothetical protein